MWIGEVRKGGKQGEQNPNGRTFRHNCVKSVIWTTIVENEEFRRIFSVLKNLVLATSGFIQAFRPEIIRIHNARSH